MMQQSYLINRRQVLRGSGAALALPLLDIMSPAIQASPQTKPPIRLGVLYKGMEYTRRPGISVAQAKPTLNFPLW